MRSATISILLLLPQALHCLVAPRVVLAHEHRDRRRDFGRRVSRWDDHDGAMAAFAAAAARRGLTLSLVGAERPVSEVRGQWRRWTADLSILEVSAH